MRERVYFKVCDFPFPYAYDDLATHFEEPSDEIPREQARELLVTESDTVDEPADADYILDRLLEGG